MSKIYRDGRIDISTPTGGTYTLQEGRTTEVIRSKKISPKGVSGSLFAFIVLILFTIAFSHYIRTGTFINFSFKSLIDYFAGMPDVSISFAQIDLTIYSDWGLFNFLRSFLNFFTGGFELMITITGFISQGFVVIGYLVGLLFI